MLESRTNQELRGGILPKHGPLGEATTVNRRRKISQRPKKKSKENLHSYNLQRDLHGTLRAMNGTSPGCKRKIRKGVSFQKGNDTTNKSSRKRYTREKEKKQKQRRGKKRTKKTPIEGSGGGNRSTEAIERETFRAVQPSQREPCTSQERGRRGKNDGEMQTRR